MFIILIFNAVSYFKKCIIFQTNIFQKLASFGRNIKIQNSFQTFLLVITDSEHIRFCDAVLKFTIA